MIESALSLTLPEKISWERSLPRKIRDAWAAGTYAKGTERSYQGRDYKVVVNSTDNPPSHADWVEVELTQVDVDKPLDYVPNTDPASIDDPYYALGDTPEILKYAIRDRELQYRDLVVAAAAMDVSFRISTIWNFKANRLELPAAVDRNLRSADGDTLRNTTQPSAVNYTPNSAPPEAALTADRNLYDRDNILWQALAIKSQSIFNFENQGLVLNWKMDEISNGQVVDSADFEDNGVVSGSPTVDAAAQAVIFDGTDDMIDTSIPVSRLSTGAIPHTVEAWVKVDPFPEAHPDYTILKLSNSINGHIWSINSSGHLTICGLTVSGDSTLQATDPMKLSFSVWTHLAASYDGSTLRIYKNGVLIRSEDTSISFAVASGDSIAMKVGKNFSGTSDYFKGQIHSVRVWKTKRSDYDIIRNYRNRLEDNSPIPLLNYTLGITSVWTQAEGLATSAEVHTNLPLDRDLFRNPDRNLAARDNVVAAHVSKLLDILDSPFEHANKLQVEIYHPDDVTKTRLADTYIISETESNATQRVWIAEPRLQNRMRLVYRRAERTIQWISEDTNNLHTPQPISGLQAKGLTAEQLIRVIPRDGDAATANFWSQKAGVIRFGGNQESHIADLVYPSSFTAGGWKLENGSVAISNFESIATTFEGYQITQGKFYQISFLVRAGSSIKLLGNQTVTTGLDGDDDGGIILPNGSFAIWRTFLPEGAWEMEISYVNGSVESGTVSQLPSTIYFDRQPVSLIPLPYGADPLTVQTAKFLVQGKPSARGQDLKISSFAALGQMIIRSIKFSTVADPALRYQFSSRVGAQGVFRNEISLFRNQYALIVIRVKAASTLTKPSATLTLNVGQPLPLIISRIQLQEISENTPTPNTTGFEYWKTEALDRAIEGLQDAYRLYLEDYYIRPDEVEEGIGYTVISGEAKYGSFTYKAGDEFTGVEGVAWVPVSGTPQVIETAHELPEFRIEDDVHGFLWSPEATAKWIHALEAYDEDVKQAFRQARAGDVGRPALVPEGLEYDTFSGTVKAHYGITRSVPVIRAFEPWMMDLGIRVAHENFWYPIDESLLNVALSTAVVPTSSGDFPTIDPNYVPPAAETPQNTLGPSVVELEWSWTENENGNKTASITNPNAVPMYVRWQPLSSPFVGPTPVQAAIPAGGTQAFAVRLPDASSHAIRNCVGTWEANGATGALTGKASAA